jgi:hypothetical protein
LSNTLVWRAGPAAGPAAFEKQHQRGHTKLRAWMPEIIESTCDTACHGLDLAWNSTVWKSCSMSCHVSISYCNSFNNLEEWNATAITVVSLCLT